MKHLDQLLKTTAALIVFGILVSFNSIGNDNYHKAMQNALNEFKNAQSITEFQTTANSFNRISNLSLIHI